MKISSYSYQAKPAVNFTSNPLYKVNVKKLMPNGSYRKVTAYFSELINTEPTDMKAMKEILSRWGLAAKYIKAMHLEFSTKNPFVQTFAIELAGKKPLEEKILSLCSLRELPKDSMWLEFIQARPDLLAVDEIGIKIKNREFTGAGELNLYGALRKTKENELDYMGFESRNDRFFENIKLYEIGLGYHSKMRYIYPKKISEFMESVEKKYKFKR